MDSIIGIKSGVQSSTELTSSINIPMIIIKMLTMMRMTYLLVEMDVTSSKNMPGTSSIINNLDSIITMNNIECDTQGEDHRKNCQAIK